jgi:Cof subfamily protein (haloacid dehalogenase superfamily)
MIRWTKYIGVLRLCASLVNSFSVLARPPGVVSNPGETYFRSTVKPLDFFKHDDVELDNIKVIFSDMDGTLLLPTHEVSERSIKAITDVTSKGINFLPATGRNRNSMATAVGSKCLNAFGRTVDKLPGIFSQGLMVYGVDGSLIHEEFLDFSLVEEVESYCNSHSLSVVAYSGDSLFATRYTDYTLGLTKYKDPIPDLVPVSLRNIEKKGLKINKLILLAAEPDIQRHRPLLETIFHNKVSFTKAVPETLEILPFGASKGKGVAKFLEHHKIHPSHAMAFGDAENDLEMIQTVKYGIAMDNAKSELLEVAYRRTLSNAENGVAHVLEQIVSNRQ